MKKSAAFSTSSASAYPLLRDFSKDWQQNLAVEWRRSYQENVRTIVEGVIWPFFKNLRIHEIDRNRILEFRSQLAKPRESNDGRVKVRSTVTINRFMRILSQIFKEAELQFGITSPCKQVSKLKMRKSHVAPFTLPEVTKLLKSCPHEYRVYLTVRFFCGLRSGEINGLKWKYVDLERGHLLIRETLVRGRTEYTKTNSSQRDIDIPKHVLDALRTHYAKHPARRRSDDDYVFHTSTGSPVDTHNFCNRVWNPLLNKVGFSRRRPYQTRHTCATLLLAAGENPEWIARTLGHSSTMMLFQVYSRYVPNLTRRDGSAFNKLMDSHFRSSAAHAARA